MLPEKSVSNVRDPISMQIEQSANSACNILNVGRLLGFTYDIYHIVLSFFRNSFVEKKYKNKRRHAKEMTKLLFTLNSSHFLLLLSQ